MSNVTVTIAGRHYTVACAAGEESHIELLGRSIDTRLEGLPNLAAQSEARTLLFAALLLADELHEQTNSEPAQADGRAASRRIARRDGRPARGTGCATGGVASPSQNPLIILEPAHEGRDALVNAGCRPIAEIATDRCRCRRKVRGHVAGLHRQELALRDAAAFALEDRDHVGEALGAVVADVVQRVRLLAAAGLDRAIVGGGWSSAATVRRRCRRCK
jgi:cell division protein ZapA